MAKKQEYFAFHCNMKPDLVFGRLEQQVKALTDREYLLEQTETGFNLGIGRGGHQGGYWYRAEVSEDGGGSHISGRVVYQTWDGREIKTTWVNKLEFAIWFAVLLPLILVIWIYRIFRPEVTMEDRFVEFMTEKMDCQHL